MKININEIKISWFERLRLFISVLTNQKYFPLIILRKKIIIDEQKIVDVVGFEKIKDVADYKLSATVEYGNEIMQIFFTQADLERINQIINI
jgi:hypothetical protein